MGPHRIFARFRARLNLNNAVVTVALLIAASWVWNTIEAIQRNFVLQQQVDALAQQNQVAQLEDKAHALQNEYYKSNEYLDLNAREHLSKAAPGEKMLILAPNTVHQSPSAQPVISDQVPITQRSNFAQWMYFLFGKKS